MDDQVFKVMLVANLLHDEWVPIFQSLADLNDFQELGFFAIDIKK